MYDLKKIAKPRSICAKRYEESHRLYGLRREVDFHERERETAAKHTSLRPVSFTFSLLSLFSYACSGFYKQVAHFIPLHLRPTRVFRIFPNAANVCRAH